MLYQYVLRDNCCCPICKNGVNLYVDRLSGPIGRTDLCHPLKRIIVKGMWWWRKYCPVEGVHYHTVCNTCKVSWIVMSDDQSEANPEIKEAYL